MVNAVQDPPVASPPPPPPPRGGRGLVRGTLFHLGELLLTLGALVLLLVVYEVWITNIFADRNNERHISQLRHEYDTVTGLPKGTQSSLPIGSAMGIIYIPRFGRDYAEAIVQGDTTPDPDQLMQGTAHYGSTQLPGQKGNFAVAGHRVGKGSPFLNLDQLQSGDAVVVETRSYWYVYRVLGAPTGGNPQTDTPSTIRYDGGSVRQHGREIIVPSDGAVVSPIPNHPQIPASSATEALMTMTTCHPKFTSTHRMVIFAKLAGKVAADKNSATTKASDMPAAITKLYSEVRG